MTMSTHETHDVVNNARDHAAIHSQIAIDASGNLVKEAYGKPGVIEKPPASTVNQRTPFEFNTPAQFLEELKKDFASIPQAHKGELTRADLANFAHNTKDVNARNAANIAELHFTDLEALSTVPGQNHNNKGYLTASDIDTTINLKKGNTSAFRSHFDLGSAAKSTGLEAVGAGLFFGSAYAAEVPPVAIGMALVGAGIYAAGALEPMFTKDNAEQAEIAAKKVDGVMGSWAEINGGHTGKR